MPELPEVETVVRTLRPHVVGRTLTCVTLRRDDFATPAGFAWTGLKGRTITDVRRRAKRIVFSLCGGEVFVIHLGMTGRLTVVTPDVPFVLHTHAVFGLDSGAQVRLCDPRRFGRLEWLGRAPADAGVGPEPLTLRASDLAARLVGTRRAVKTALLDQRLIAGLGNIYADEALFAAGIHPETACRDLDARSTRRLSRGIKATLRRAIRAGGSTLRDYVDASGKAGSFQTLHRVYARGGQACGRCGTPITRIVLGGRSTHYCHTCQPPTHAPPTPAG